MAVQLDLEGIVAKDAGSVYSPGRTTRWLKIKNDYPNPRTARALPQKKPTLKDRPALVRFGHK
jgi:ATP-dependent DNA ligase